MNNPLITRRSALKLGALCATGSAVLSQSTGMGRASQHEPPSADEVTLSNDNITYIEPDPEAGFNYPYFLYASSTADSTNGYDRPLLVIPTSTGGPKNSFNEHLQMAKRTAEGLVVRLADEIGVPAIHPVFPKYLDDPYRNYIDPQALSWHAMTAEDSLLSRPDKQYLAMIDDAQDRLTTAGHMLTDTILLEGTSASGTFTARFTAMHPERVDAMAAGGNGAFILPMKTLTDDVPVQGNPNWGALSFPEKALPYPAGVYDLNEFIGNEFNEQAWQNVSKYFWVGSEDQPEPDPDNTSYRDLGREYRDETYIGPPSIVEKYGIPDLMIDIYGEYRVDTRFRVSRAAYQSVDPDAQFTIYDRVGHNYNPEITSDIADFHRTHIINKYGPVLTREEIAVQGGYLTEDGTRELNTGEQMIYTAVFKNHRMVPENVTVTLTIDGTEVESVTRELPPEETGRIPIGYTFTEPGTYTVQINGDEPEPQPLTVLPAETPTPTPAPTSSPTPTPAPDAPTETDTSTPTSHETPGDSGPGFGIGAALSGVASAGYILARSDNDTE